MVKKKEVKKAKVVKKSFKDIFTLPRTRRTFGQKAADKMTTVAGSWGFIIGFFLFLLVWIGVNGYVFSKHVQGDAFDPYPFILLNLILSCLAAVQAPIILMSQNRQAQRDRLKAEYDFRINKKAEEEIRQIKRMLFRFMKK